MIRLIIENNELEINEEVKVAITKQFENLSNPTLMYNDWSKTVSIPETQKNNEIFGKIFRPDKIITESYLIIGLNFDPSKKLDFKLFYNDSLLMEGYAKLNTIKKNDGIAVYELNLFGSLGKAMYEMQQITFNPEVLKDSTKSKYYIDGSQYFTSNINASLVRNCWGGIAQTKDDLTSKSVYEYIGFAPNNSYMKDFDYTIFLNGANTSKKFSEVLEENGFEEATGISPETAIKDGMLPREIGEYRSYHLLPYIYVNKLFRIFAKKTEDVTGYKVDLDPLFFNKRNIYWYNLVMMLKAFLPETSSSVTNDYSATAATMIWAMNAYNLIKTSRITFDKNKSVEKKNIYNYDSGRFNLDDGKLRINYNTFVNFKITMNDGGWEKYFHFTKTNALEVNLRVVGLNGNATYTKVLAIHEDVDPADLGLSSDDYYNIIRIKDAPTRNGTRMEWKFGTLLATFIQSYSFGTYATVDFSAKWVNNTPTAKHMATPLTYEMRLEVSPFTSDCTFSMNTFRSGSLFTLNDLWNNDQSLYDVIINYCKMFRINIVVDDAEKTIKFISSTTYFNKPEIEDWTDKIDTTKDFVIKPIVADKKYLKFNYTNNKSEISQKYLDEFGVNFGELKYNTEYNFNEDSQDLFEKAAKTTATYTPNVLSWTNLYQRKNIIYSLPAEIYIDCLDKDKKFVDVFGSFFFTERAKFDTEDALYLREVRVTDDTLFMDDKQTYFYAQDQDATTTPVITYTKLNVVYKGNYTSTFNKPMKNYTYKQDYDDALSIYDMFWKNYLNETYNIQNKVLTCNVRLSANDFMSFKHNRFVIINNILYFVNKIYNYDVTEDLTKIEFIQVTDMSNYSANEYLKSLDELFNTEVYLSYRALTSRVALVTYNNTLTDIRFENGTKQLFLEDAKTALIIEDKTVYALFTGLYTDKDDILTDVKIINDNNEATLLVDRYSISDEDGGYPYIESNDNIGGSFYMTVWNDPQAKINGAKPTIKLDILALPANISTSGWSVVSKMVQFEDGREIEIFGWRVNVKINGSYISRTPATISFITNGDTAGFANSKNVTLI